MERRIEERAPRRVVGSYGSYAEAQRAVDYLSDEGFAVERVAIVAEGLRFVEQVTGRVGYGRAALQGAGSGAFVGLFFGFIFGLFSLIDPLVSALALAFWGLVVGAILGAIVATRSSTLCPTLKADGRRGAKEEREARGSSARRARRGTPLQPAKPA